MADTIRKQYTFPDTTTVCFCATGLLQSGSGNSGGGGSTDVGGAGQGGSQGGSRTPNFRALIHK